MHHSMTNSTYFVRADRKVACDSAETILVGRIGSDLNLFAIHGEFHIVLANLVPHP